MFTNSIPHLQRKGVRSKWAGGCVARVAGGPRSPTSSAKLLFHDCFLLLDPDFRAVRQLTETAHGDCLPF